MTAAPPVYPDLDLRDFPYMPLDVVRLRDSELGVLATGEEFRAAVMLWCAAWHQVPASSLPSDDRLLAQLAGFGRDVQAWLEVKERALHGFQIYADGRLYHPVIAEKATEADNKKKAQRERTAKATAARAQRQETSDDERNDQRDDARNVHQGKGREGNIKPEANASGRAREKRGTRLPDDWQPDDATFGVHELGSAEASARELEKFRDHWKQKAGDAGKKLDWNAAWRNWCRRSLEMRGGVGPPGVHSGMTASNPKPGNSVHEAARRLQQYTEIASGPRDDGQPPRRAIGFSG